MACSPTTPSSRSSAPPRPRQAGCGRAGGRRRTCRGRRRTCRGRHGPQSPCLPVPVPAAVRPREASAEYESTPPPRSEVIMAEPDDHDLDALLLIRHFEQALLRLFGEGRISGTTHTCLGQEYIPVALAPLLRPDDFVFSNHRGHGHYLALTRDATGLLAEVMGR